MQILPLILGWAIGLALCVFLVRQIAARWRLPWKAALMYFGLMPYPDEVRRRRPVRRPAR